MVLSPLLYLDRWLGEKRLQTRVKSAEEFVSGLNEQMYAIVWRTINQRLLPLKSAFQLIIDSFEKS
jgi:hypothetical protein